MGKKNVNINNFNINKSKRVHEELYEYQYTTPNKKVVKECLPALKRPEGRKAGKKEVTKGRLFMILGAVLFLINFPGIASGNVVFILLQSAIFGGIAVYGALQTKKGHELLDRLSRYQRYMKVLEHQKFASIEELGSKVAKSSKTVIKDLQYMMDKGWFLEGHLDEKNTQFILTDHVYEQYKLSIEGQKMKEEEEKLRREEESDPVKREVNKILREGEEYISKIHKLNDLILGEEISVKMDKIEETLISIFDLVKRNPGKCSDLRKLMQYYLPMTVKVLERYRDFENERISSSQLEEGKRDIEETLDKVESAFINLREKLFQEDVLDVSSDLDVLETMMSQEGLIDDEISIGNK